MSSPRALQLPLTGHQPWRHKRHLDPQLGCVFEEDSWERAPSGGVSSRNRLGQRKSREVGVPPPNQGSALQLSRGERRLGPCLGALSQGLPDSACLCFGASAGCIPLGPAFLHFHCLLVSLPLGWQLFESQVLQGGFSGKQTGSKYSMLDALQGALWRLMSVEGRGRGSEGQREKLSCSAGPTQPGLLTGSLAWSGPAQSHTELKWLGLCTPARSVFGYRSPREGHGPG